MSSVCRKVSALWGVALLCVRSRNLITKWFSTAHTVSFSFEYITGSLIKELKKMLTFCSFFTYTKVMFFRFLKLQFGRSSLQVCFFNRIFVLHEKHTHKTDKSVAALNLMDQNHSRQAECTALSYPLALTGFSSKRFKSQLCHIETVWTYQSSPSFYAPISSFYRACMFYSLDTCMFYSLDAETWPSGSVQISEVLFLNTIYIMQVVST